MKQSLRLIASLLVKFAILTAAVGLVLRIALIFSVPSDQGFSAGEWFQVLLTGAVNDLCAAVVGFALMWLFMMSVGETKYRKPWGYIILAAIVAGFCYVTFFDTVFDTCGGIAPLAASAVMGYWAATFAMRLFLPQFRSIWTTVWFVLLITLCVGVIVFSAVSEYISLHQAGSIWDSRHVLWLALGIILATIVVTWYLFRREFARTVFLRGWRWKAIAGPVYIVLFVLAVYALKFNVRFQNSPNPYVNELQAGALCKFYESLNENERR